MIRLTLETAALKSVAIFASTSDALATTEAELKVVSTTAATEGAEDVVGIGFCSELDASWLTTISPVLIPSTIFFSKNFCKYQEHQNPQCL